jgi:hypothetical protein
VARTVSREDDRFETVGIIAFLELQVASGKRQEEAGRGLTGSFAACSSGGEQQEHAIRFNLQLGA